MTNTWNISKGYIFPEWSVFIGYQDTSFFIANTMCLFSTQWFYKTNINFTMSFYISGFFSSFANKLYTGCQICSTKIISNYICHHALFSSKQCLQHHGLILYISILIDSMHLYILMSIIFVIIYICYNISLYY